MSMLTAFQISEKDLSLLEERIKRAAKTRSAEARRSMVVPLSACGKPILQQAPQVNLQEQNNSRELSFEQYWYYFVGQENEQVITVESTPEVEYEDEEPEEQLPPPVVQ